MPYPRLKGRYIRHQIGIHILLRYDNERPSNMGRPNTFQGNANRLPRPMYKPGQKNVFFVTNTKATINDSKMMLLPNIPMGGRLKNFIKNWEKITNEKWVLSTIKNGL